MSKIGRSSYVEHESTFVVSGENYRKQQSIHRQLQKQAAAIDEQAESWRETFRMDNPAPALLVHSESGPVQLPERTAWSVIRIRAAIPIGSFDVIPVLIAEDEQRDEQPTNALEEIKE